jgi:large subunit ribosomal protein L13
MEHTIDATNKSIGRVATQAAVFLMGKDTALFKKNVAPKVKVKIENVSKANISVKKIKETKYNRYSGYPGGLKKVSMEKIIENKGYSEIFRKAVYGMLPANRLRKVMMKNLVIKD